MILLDQGPGGKPALFDSAREVIVALRLDEVAGALARLDAARRDGFFVAGYLGYEAGYALEPRLQGLMPEVTGPLLAMGVYEGPEVPVVAAGPVRFHTLTPMISRADYGAAFRRVKDYIAAGDCYQVNLTFPMQGRLIEGSVQGLFSALRARQAVGFGGIVDLGVGPALVSRSPELFLRLDAAGRIEARPMKGTAARDRDPVRDAELAEELRASEKGRAENLMIVDLLRNDIARIARVGSVKVPELFAIESYATLHQMVSRVVGQLAEPATLAGVMAALFPCGSITGAPKIRAMEIIRQVEVGPRGAYCGAVGWMGPDGAACFNVAIRTLSVWPDGRVQMGVGGGIVQDSEEESEWQEALLKARFTVLPS